MSIVNCDNISKITAKSDKNGYTCIRSMKHRIDKELTAPVSLLYEQVKKFRRSLLRGHFTLIGRKKCSQSSYRRNIEKAIIDNKFVFH